MQVVDYHDRSETSFEKRPRTDVFEVPGKAARQSRDVPVDSEYRMASGGEEPRMAPAASGEIEYRSGRWHESGEARDPGGDWHQSLYDIICES